MGTRSAACGRSQRCTAPPPMPKAAATPWLVFQYGKGRKSQAFFNICDPNSCTTLRKSIPELRGKSYWQKTSHRNWLITLCQDKRYKTLYKSDWNHGDCSLFNPVSLESIHLPSLLEWISKPEKYVLIDCVLTSPPSSRHHDGSTVIFLFSTPYNRKDDVLLLFCHTGDNQWRKKTISRRDVAGDSEGAFGYSLHSVKGKLYVTFVNEDHRLLEIDEEHLLENNNVRTLSIRPLELKFQPLGVDSFDLYYVETDDAIFQIWVCFNRRCKQVIQIEVSRLDFAGMKWEEMDSLGDHVIFLGRKTGFCCSAAELGLKSGCLYYALPGDQNLYKFEANGGNAILPRLELETPWFPLQWIMLMPEDGQKRVENNGEQQQKQQDIITLKEVKGNKTCSASNINGSRDKQNEEEISAWDTLSEDTVVMISNYLHPLDYVHFRSVCKANRRVMPPTTQKRGSNSTGCPYISAWLMFPRDETYNYIDPVHDKEAYLMSSCKLMLQGATIRYQKNGWLLMSREKKIFFHNPFTREIIKISDLPDGYIFSIFCFDVSPTSSYCLVYAIDTQSESDPCILSNIRSEDIWYPILYPASTSVKKLMPLHGTAPIYYKDWFYLVDCEGTLGAFSAIEEVSWSVLATPKKIFKNDMHPNLLVECGGDLLLVKLGHLGTSVRVFRLDLSEMEWVKVESLGKHMLFISETSCLSGIAPDSQMENMICFPRVCLNGEGVLLYSLETGSYHSSGKNQHSLVNKFYATEGWLSNCTWIQPNWTKATEQELDWLNPLR